MKVAPLIALPALCLLALSSTGAKAASLFTQAGSTGELQSPQALTFAFAAGAGAGLAKFDINGYRSLDGDNAWSDRFTLVLNGTDVLSGTYNLGGGGNNVTYFQPGGATVNVSSAGGWSGGTASFEVPLDFASGTNTLAFRYDGGFQGLDDEAWGLSGLEVSGNAAPPAPPPAPLTQIFAQPTPTGALESPGSVDFLFNSLAGNGFVSFDLNGFKSLDGNNAWSDVFTLSLNGIDLLSGTYDLGGGGGNATFFAPVGSTINPQSFGLWNGGLARFQVPLNLLGGENHLRLSYSGNFQGLGDEGWGVSNLSVQGPSGAVPEPTSWALMIAGFGLVGTALRRRTRAVAA